MHEPIGNNLLSKTSLGSPVSYELNGNHIVAKLLGIFPIRRIHLKNVHYLRLAASTEVSPVYLAFNWPQFMAHRRSLRPVYVLQTHGRTRLFMKLEGDAHFQLRQAIARHNEQHRKMAA